MKIIINHLPFLFTIISTASLNCGCYSTNKNLLSNKRKESPLTLEIKLPREINLRYIQVNALKASKDMTRKTNEFHEELSKEFHDQSNWKHYLSISRPIAFVITNTSSQPVYFLWRHANIIVKLKNEKSGKDIVCKYVKKTAKSFFGRRGNFEPNVVLASLEPGEYIVGHINPADYSDFPAPLNYIDMAKTPWDLTIEIEFFSFHYYDVDMFSGKLKSNAIKVIIYPLSEEH